MADETGDFRFAGAYVELSLKDNTAAGEEEARKRIEDAPPVEIGAKLAAVDVAKTVTEAQGEADARSVEVAAKLKVDERSVDDMAVRTKERTKVIGDESPVKAKLELDDRSIAEFDAKVRAAVAAMSAQTSPGGAGAAAAVGGGGGLAAGGLIAGGVALASGPLAGAALLSIPAAFAAIGVAAEKSDPAVSQAFSNMTTAATKAAHDGFSPLVPSLVQLADQAKTTVTAMEPDFAAAAAATGPLLTAVGSGFLKAAQEGVGGSVPILQSLRPVAQALGDDFVKIEQGIGGFFKNLDPGTAAEGLSVLGTDVKDVLPAVGSLVNDIAPLANGLLSVLGPAATQTAQDLGFLRPVAEGVGSAFRFLAPDIAEVAPPALALIGVTKLLSGSWLDFGGAASKVGGLFQDANGQFDKGQSTLNSLAKVMGYTTESAKAASVAQAEDALQTAKSAAAKATLTAEVDRQAAAEAAEAVAADASAKNRLALIEAEDSAAASAAAATAATEAETAAQEALSAASEASTFTMGPLGIALGVVGGAMALLGLNSSKATAPASDLTQELGRLAQAAPGAAQGILSGDPALTALVNKATQAGVSVKDLVTAYGQGPQALQAFSSGLEAQQKVFGDTMIGISQINGMETEVQDKQRAQSVMSIKDLTDAVNSGKTAYDTLDPSVKNLVDEYNAQNEVQGQLHTSITTLNQQQQANVAVTGQGRTASTLWTSAIQQASEATRLHGGNLLATTQQMYQFEVASGETTLSVENYEKAQLAAAAANFSAEQSFQQLDNAVSAAQQQVTQAAQSVANAQHGEEQAARGVITAQQGVQQAVQGVQSAEQGLANTERSSTQTEQALTAARAAAQQQLEQLHRQVTDQTGTEEAAELRLAQAKEAVAAAGLTNTNLRLTDLYNLAQVNPAYLQQYQLLLDLQDAQNNLNDTLASGTQLRQQQQQADQLGINGNAGVVSAQQQVIQAQQQQQAAAQALVAAQRQVAQASQGVQDAVYAEGQAHIATQQAIQGEHTASVALTQAKQAASRATDDNSAAASRNQTTIIGLYDAQIAAGKSTQDATTAVEDEGVKLGITKGQVDAVITSIQTVPKSVAFSVVGQPSLDVSQLIQNAQSQGINIDTLGLPSSVIGNARADFPMGSAYAEGGSVLGFGGPKDDLNLAWLSHREYVQPVDSVDYYGLPFMEAIRQKVLPKELFGQFASIAGFADGGQVSGTTLLGIDDRLVGWDALLGATSAALTTLGARGVPALPKPQSAISFGALGSGMISFNASAGVAQWAPDILTVLGMLGQPAAWLGTVERRMNQESGGNPNAINLWDSNAAAGDPSRGLMQTIGSTFKAYRNPSLPDNIYNPLANIYAGLNYAIHRYGSLAALNRPGGYDTGGYALPGVTPVINQTGVPEMLLPPGMTNTMETINAAVQGGGMGRTSIENHWHITQLPNEDGYALAHRVSAQTSWDMAHMVGG